MGDALVQSTPCFLGTQALAVKIRDETHLRPGRYDAVLGVLFAEMAPRLAKGYGRNPQSE